MMSRDKAQAALVGLGVILFVVALYFAVEWRRPQREAVRKACEAAGGLHYRGKCWSISKEIKLGASHE